MSAVAVLGALVGVLAGAPDAGATVTSTTTISVSPSTSVEGQVVVLSAVVSGGAGTATGFVGFDMGAQSLCSAPLSGGEGACTVTISSYNQGAVPLEVRGEYSGDGTYAPSVGTTTTVVEPGATVTALTWSTMSSPVGASVTFIASVTGVAPSVETVQGGTVDFTASGVTLCSESVGNGSAFCTLASTTSAPPSVADIVAVYGGNPQWLGSSSQPATESVPEIPTSVQVAPSPPTVEAGQQVTFNVGVLTQSGIAAGNVAIFANGVGLCSVYVSEGSASCTSTNAPVGMDTITASFYDELHVYASSTTTSPWTLTVLASGSAKPAPDVAVAATPDGAGYWLAGADGSVGGYGDAQNYGSMAGHHLNAPIVDIVATPDGRGYWLLGRDGGVFSFGDAAFYGSTGSLHLNAPVVGMAVTPDGKGYWFVASDGGVFSYGDAAFHGSMGGSRLNEPVVGMAADPATGGYWLVASDGGVFAFAAPFEGSTGGLALSKPIVGMEASNDGSGYRFVASDGGVFAFGVSFSGSMGGRRLDAPIAGIAGSGPSGYWLVGQDGGIFSFGGAPFEGSPA